MAHLLRYKKHSIYDMCCFFVQLISFEKTELDCQIGNKAFKSIYCFFISFLPENQDKCFLGVSVKGDRSELCVALIQLIMQ